MKQSQELSVDNVSRFNQKRQGKLLNTRKALNSFYLNQNFKSQRFFYQSSIEPLEVISEFYNSVKSSNSAEKIYEYLHSAALKMGYGFTAFGTPNADNTELIVNLTDFTKNVYSFKQSFDESENIMIKTFNNKAVKITNNVCFLKLPHLKDFRGIVVPFVTKNETGHIFVAGSYSGDYRNDETINILCNYATLLIANNKLNKKLCSANDIDNLTGLDTHRKLQEKLSEAVKNAEQSGESVSVIMFDINNITKINREYGHAKGDEIISRIAGVIKKNIRKNDTAGRYGGDETVIILPDTDNAKACRTAKSINNSLSELYFDGIGPVKTGIGVATYPARTQNKERLLVLVEQSMLISKHNGYKTGIFDVVSAQDVDFWDDVALNSLARVIAKRHSQWGFNFEDELVKRFIKAKKLPKIPVDVVSSLACAIDAKDTYTRGHSQEVSKYAEALARAINLPEKTVHRIKLAALLHDVGKIGISESILRKPGALTDHEWEVMKQHPVIGVKKVLEPVKSLKDLIPAVKHHHERIDGFGYPDMLKGDEIPLSARIVAIADAFHALISHRPYRKALSRDTAIQILRDGAGTQWDARLTEKFVLIAPSLYIEK